MFQHALAEDEIKRAIRKGQRRQVSGKGAQLDSQAVRVGLGHLHRLFRQVTSMGAHVGMRHSQQAAIERGSATDFQSARRRGAREQLREQLQQRAARFPMDGELHRERAAKIRPETFVERAIVHGRAFLKPTAREGAA